MIRRREGWENEAGPIFNKVQSPEEWISEVKRLGYSAAYWPDIPDSYDIALDYANAAKKEDIVIGEVHIFNNTIDPDDQRRKEAVAYAKKRLELADRVGAISTVNLSGSKAEAGNESPPNNITAHSDNFSEATFEIVVDTIREIIDDVKPKRTFYTLELFPWLIPNSPDAYLRLLKAVDREQFAVHLDLVNIINSPET